MILTPYHNKDQLKLTSEFDWSTNSALPIKTYSSFEQIYHQDDKSFYENSATKIAVYG